MNDKQDKSLQIQSRSHPSARRRADLQDSELTSPEHDALVLWSDRHIEEIVAQVTPSLPAGKATFLIREARTKVEGWLKSYRYSASVYGEDRSSIIARTEYLLSVPGCGLGEPPVPTWHVDKVTWEKPVLKSTTVVGYCDLAVQLSGGDLSIIYRRDGLEISSYTAYSRSSPPPDALSWRSTGSFEAYIECKVVIPSLGELLRQIRFYQEYLPGKSFVVVSPDARWERALRHQDIGFTLAP